MGWAFVSDGILGWYWQEYIRDLEKEEEEEKRLQKVAFWINRAD